MCTQILPATIACRMKTEMDKRCANKFAAASEKEKKKKLTGMQIFAVAMKRLRWNFRVVCRCWLSNCTNGLCNFAEIPFAADVNHREADLCSASLIRNSSSALAYEFQFLAYQASSKLLRS